MMTEAVAKKKRLRIKESEGLWKEPTELYAPRRKDVTVCISAACRLREGTAIVQCCDWQGTREDYISSDNTDKMREIGRAGILLAGDLTAADDLVVEIDKSVKDFLQKANPSTTDIDTSQYQEDLRNSVDHYRRRLVSHYLGRTLSMTLEEFWKQGVDSLTELEHREVFESIKDMELGASLLISTVDADDGDVIMQINQDGTVHWPDNFAVIGGGSPIAFVYFIQRDCGKSTNMANCFYRGVFLKKSSGKKSSVG